ncbi:hypothetical protein [Thermoanaerobacterium sp. RBIITD]|uniref:Mu transposase domain-containing protein n=1 Tax=Thermoanaerobacterium sp. RBIITD TaxID=1550240 RepID=UPI000BB91554|nr:hypothetical protein [Thermoanaerobacterium sp. RBIITD]
MKRIKSKTQRKMHKLLELSSLEEQKALASLPVTPYDTAVKLQIKVNSDGLIHFDANRYSVPLDFAGYEVTVNVLLLLR